MVLKKDWSTSPNNITQNAFFFSLSFLPISKSTSALGASVVPLKLQPFPSVYLTCLYISHPLEESKFTSEVFRTKRCLFPKTILKVQCVSLIRWKQVSIPEPVTMTEYCDTLITLSQWRPIPNDMTANGEGWFFEHCYQK